MLVSQRISTLLFTAAMATCAGLLAQQQPPSVGAIVGRVVEQGTDTPVPDARVTLMVAARPVPGQIPQQREATSGADGSFRFDGVEPGTYRLTVQKTGFAGSGPFSPPTMVTVVAGQPAAPVLALERGAVIAGRVLAPNGQALSDAQVTAVRRRPGAPARRLMMAAPPVTTNDLGEFRLHSLSAGEYFIQAGPRPRPPMMRTDPSPTTTAITFYPGTPDPSGAQPLSVGRGATLSGVEFTLQEVPAFSVRGLVVDEAGLPVENASVMFMSDPRVGMPTFGGPGRARSAADGQFRIDGVAAGDYLASAAAPVVITSIRGAADGAVGGVAGPIAAGVGGGVAPVMTEFQSTSGLTTTYRFDPSGQVRVTVRNGDVIDLQLIARRASP